MDSNDTQVNEGLVYDEEILNKSRQVVDLVDKLHNDIPTFSEIEFVRTYLQTLYAFHTGEIMHDGNPVDITRYLQHADITAYQEVILTAPDGSEVFRVPSILVAYEIFDEETAKSVPQVAMEAEAKMNVIPNASIGARIFEEKLVSKVKGNPNISKAQQRWDEFFVRYGYPPVYNKTVSGPSTEVIDEYDEL